ncbi:hypothetical protein [Alkalispirochaeta alkalica]|uniref:hypothetical protein n=1 Tax=Alkalispirochaeta alkalica TaxID=46356 RepID=UPI00035FF9B0|nr:hypothetical protein [Alkalispirochaeta alkalica]
MKTEFRFSLPKGTGFTPSMGSRIIGTMRLIRVKDLLAVYQDARVRENPGYFYVILLSRIVEKLGDEKMVTTKTIEKLAPDDFSFLVDFMNEINHSLIRRVAIQCGGCGVSFQGEFAVLGEA